MERNPVQALDSYPRMVGGAVERTRSLGGRLGRVRRCESCTIRSMDAWR